MEIGFAGLRLEAASDCRSPGAELGSSVILWVLLLAVAAALVVVTLQRAPRRLGSFATALPGPGARRG